MGIILYGSHPLQTACGKQRTCFDADTITCAFESCNPSQCSATARTFGRITGKYVIYRGEPCDVSGIRYINAEEYLRHVGREPAGNHIKY